MLGESEAFNDVPHGLAARERVDRQNPDLRMRQVESLHRGEVWIAVARFGVASHHERTARVLGKGEATAGIDRWNTCV